MKRKQYVKQTISNTGFWNNECAHEFDKSLCGALVEYFRENQLNDTICDLGCGCHGYYTQKLVQKGLNCIGFDGNPNTYDMTNGLCKVRDLTNTFDDVYDWIICLEVAEHVPKIYENILIENIHRNNRKGVILSWAVEGQDGLGHVNCQNNEYVKTKFKHLGYVNNIDLENRFRNASSLPWFKNTIMVFTRSNTTI